MELHVYSAFVVATALMIALPGPSVILTIAHSLSFGWKNGLCTVAGATAGIGVQLLIAVAGLSSLLHFVSQTFSWLRWAGAVYLIYLGLKQWKNSHLPLIVNTEDVSRSNLFLQGLIITIPNPKSLIFIAAFLPQFIDPGKPLYPQLSLIIPTFICITFTVTSIWALIAGNARAYLSKKNSVQSIMRTTGGLMIIAGLGLAMARRGN